MIERLELEGQLCFALYAATNAITRDYDPMLKEIGLTYPQYLVMIVLWQDGPSNIGDIASRLRLAPNAITPLANRLVEKGFAQRGSMAGDGRVSVLSVTEKGREAEAEALAAHRQVACDTGMEHEDMLVLIDELKRLTDRVEKAMH